MRLGLAAGPTPLASCPGAAVPAAPILTHRFGPTPLRNAHTYSQVAETMGDRVRILKVDTDANPEISTQLQVRAAPAGGSSAKGGAWAQY